MKRIQFICAIGLLCQLSLSGCTLLGYHIGAAIDSSGEGNFVGASRQELDDMNIGDSTILSLQDGRMLRGLYMGQPVPHRDSLVVWANRAPVIDCENRQQLRINDPIVLHRAVGDSLDAIFLGAYKLGMYYRLPDSDDVVTMRWPAVKGISWCDGGRWFPPPVSEQLRYSRLETQESVRLLTISGMVELRGGDIHHIQRTKHSSTGRTIGALVGAAVDLTVLVGAAAVSSLSSGGGSSSSSSRRDDDRSNDWEWSSGCPFVFGWSGSDWRVEMECLSGSFFRSAQRRDVARLEHTRPVDGRVRLRLADLLQEVDSIDHLALMRVAHAEGTELYPTEEGRLLAAVPHPPLSACSDRGEDILPLVRDADESCWTVLPQPDRGSWGERRWMECTFARPADRDSVTLILRVRNTDWGAHVQYGFFALFGSQLQSYYDLCNASAKERARLRTVMEREGMLQVKVWDGTQWRHSAYVWEVGVGAYRHVALRIGIAEVNSGPLRLRLEAPAGIWLVSRVAMDDRLHDDVAAECYRPVAAVRHDGADCLEKLLEEDGDYCALDTGQWADVDFRVPEQKSVPGQSYSWMIETSGYYRTKITADHEPNLAEIGRMMNEPGHFARSSDALFNRMLQNVAEAK